MKGDFSRQTFDAARHYTTVRMQQGRVQLDADSNEQADLTLHRIETEAADTIGGCGAPLDAAAFGIVLELAGLDVAEQQYLAGLDPTFDAIVAGDFVLTAGRYYVDGILCESEHPVPYTRQPDLPARTPLDVETPGFTIVYLDVWQRHLTYLDDPLLRETALGGPDTATRTRTVWQVRTVYAGTNPVTCADNPQEYLDAIAGGSGRLSARAKREDDEPNPCLVPASAGYRGLENQLYRVEIHDPGEVYDLTAGPGDVAITVSGPDEVVYTGPSGAWVLGAPVEVFRAAGGDPLEGFLAFVLANDATTKTLTLNTTLPDLGAGDQPRIRPVDATFKWSRDNGSVVTLVTQAAGAELSVAGLGPDDALGFAPGQWVELIDDATELDGRPGFLSQIAEVDRAARSVTLAVTPPAFTGEHLKLRRWDGVGAVKTNPPGTAEPYVELEDGVQVRFSEGGTYDTADHWLIPARTATVDERSGTIEWPSDEDEPRALAPDGIRHHYCKLAVLQSDGTSLTASDCRPLFPPITQLATLVYAGGDGQEARPGQPLPQRLQAGVFRGRRAVAGARVRFVAEAGGELAADLASLGGGEATFEMTTGADGFAACAWLPANDLTKLSQQVQARMLDAAGTPLEPKIDFNAQLSVAQQVAYVPGECADLAAATTVQEALDILCRRPTGGACCHIVEPGASIDELIEQLVAEGARDICLCLRAGDHQLEGLSLDGKDLDTLSIAGCCPGVRLRIGRLALKRLATVSLRGLDIVLDDAQPITLERCAEITGEDCRITRASEPGPVLVVAGARRLRIAGCVLNSGLGVDDDHLDELRELMALPEAEFARRTDELAERLQEDPAAREELAARITEGGQTENLSQAEREAYAQLVDVLTLDDVDLTTLAGAIARLRLAAWSQFEDPALVLDDGGAEALIERSDIVGALALYGARAGKLPTQDVMKIVNRRLNNGQLELRGLGALHVRDVRVTKVTCDAALLDRIASQQEAGKRIEVLRALHVVDTEVLHHENVFVARDATLTGVDFAAPEPEVGALIADSTIVVANRAPSDFRLFVASQAHEEAANVRISVEHL